MGRVIERHPAVCERVAADVIDNLTFWLEQQAKEKGLLWLLAYADDGVIWGKMAGERLVTSCEAARNHPAAAKVCPPLRAETLQEARLFGDQAELLLWRDASALWQVRLIRQAREDEAPTFSLAIDEPYLLWGTFGEPVDLGFTLLTEGSQGFLQVVPRPIAHPQELPNYPFRLKVRHYLCEDGQGFVRIATSRLVGWEGGHEDA